MFLQAQMVSHILSAVLDRRPVFWWWPTWVEALWVWGWSLVGGTLAWRICQPLPLGLAGVTALLTLFGICLVNNPLDRPTYQLDQPNLPDNGAPSDRHRGGTSRNHCTVLNTPITVMRKINKF